MVALSVARQSVLIEIKTSIGTTAVQSWKLVVSVEKPFHELKKAKSKIYMQ